MNKTYSNVFSATQMLFALSAVFLISTVAAQDEPVMEKRFLFIFCTSADMKPRVAATQKEMNMLLSTGMKGEMHPTDTLGIWTLDRELHVGKFPLLRWMPDDASTIAAEINKFIANQRYSGTNHFEALQPLLDQVIQSSPRLTVLIFCDGETVFKGTPYDNVVNQAFQARQLEQKRSKQPFIIALRMQDGKYLAGSVNFPPGMVNLPSFSPPPQPAPPASAAPAADAGPPRPTTPLVVIGSRVETNWTAYHSAMSNGPATSPAPANVSPPAPANTTASTNTVASPENTEFNRKGAWALAAGFFVGAVALISFFLGRASRADRGSYISRSMKK